MTYDSKRAAILAHISLRQRARRVLRWCLEPSKIVIAFLLAAIVLFSLGGCATTDQSYFVEVLGEPVLNLVGVECPKVVNADAHRRRVGCALTRPVRITFDPDGTDSQHELDHLHGLVHGDWIVGLGESCAEVIRAGSTKWRVGGLICKRGGVYVQQ